MIRESFNTIVEFLGFAPDATQPVEVFPFASQVILGTLAALLAWFLIHNGQRRSAEEARRLERAKFLHDLDEEYADLMARRCVAKGDFDDQEPNQRIEVPEAQMWLFEYALTESVIWLSEPRLIDPEDAESPRRYLYINGARHMEVSPGLYMDTLTLHRIIAWSRRVASGLHARIIDQTDVLNMWRHIMPLARNMRFTFMASMFDVSKARARTEDRASSFAVWYPGMRRPFYHLRSFWRLLVEASRNRMNQFRIVRRGVPASWSGDIAPLYILVQTTIRRAILERRLEVLDLAGLRLGANRLRTEDQIDPKAIDPILIRQLFGEPFSKRDHSGVSRNSEESAPSEKQVQ